MTICDDKLIVIGIYIYLRRACVATGSYKLYVVANNQLLVTSDCFHRKVSFVTLYWAFYDDLVCHKRANLF